MKSKVWHFTTWLLVAFLADLVIVPIVMALLNWLVDYQLAWIAAWLASPPIAMLIVYLKSPLAAWVSLPVMLGFNVIYLLSLGCGMFGRCL